MEIISRGGKPVSKSENASIPQGLTSPERSCTTVLSELEWRILWAHHNKDKPLPKEIPTRTWAYRHIGHLGGWFDSKRTGRVGINAYWKGYWRLQATTNGYLPAQEAGLF